MRRVEQLLIWLFFNLNKKTSKDPNKLLLSLLDATGRDAVTCKGSRRAAFKQNLSSKEMLKIQSKARAKGAK